MIIKRRREFSVDNNEYDIGLFIKHKTEGLAQRGTQYAHDISTVVSGHVFMQIQYP